ncbi:hypothetical protein TCAL_16014, partial [Tigriopus californicus]
LFNIVQFNNDVCNITATQQGVCYTATECVNKGGVPKTSCAAGFGTCCLFENSCYGVVDQQVAYFQNPKYPAVDGDPNYCTYSIKTKKCETEFRELFEICFLQVRNRDVCQVRLDLDKFETIGPSMTTLPFGQCSSDRMAIFGGRNQFGLSEGNLLCGDLTGQHLYIPIDNNAQQEEEIIRLFAMVGTSDSLTASADTSIKNYTWSIKITQIDCSIQHKLQAPSGCLQYHTSLVGSIETFNFNDIASPYPISMDYAICIQRQPGFCGVKLSTSTLGD